jgi:hypothetical protein
MTTPNISASALQILNDIFKDDPVKLAVISKGVTFVDSIIDKNKIADYIAQVKKIVDIAKQNGSQTVGTVEILECVRSILLDLYDHLESIKQSSMSSADRDFVKSHIDVIAQVVLVVVFDDLVQAGVIDQPTLTKILSFVQIAAVLDINMNVSKFASLFKCCSKSS